MTLLPQKALVVVADGGKAILYRNVGSGGGISLREEKRLSPQHLDDHGASGARPEEQSPRETDEATFAHQLAKALFKMKESGEFEEWLLVADPQTLGQLRPILHKTLTASLLRSLAKDLTHHSAREIEKALAS